MAHVGQHPKGSPSIVLLQDASTVDYASADEIDASKYQVLWSNTMDKGNYLKATGYLKVAVLLLCWDQDFDDLATKGEVDRLKAVFEGKFGYSATIAKLSPTKGGLQVQLNREVANFVGDHDGQNHLLIVYYAGHGKPGTMYGQLELHGQITPNDKRDSQQRQRDSIVWNRTEDLLRPAGADILEIFDWLIEFLGAAKHLKTTAVPGKESFTSALIYALDTLVDKKEGGRFTTDELLRTIREAPHFPKEQEPCFIGRRDQHTRAGRIMLHPLGRNGMERKIPSEADQIKKETKKHTVTLHFDFSKKPSDDSIVNLGHGLNDLFSKHRNLEVFRVRWGEMRASVTARACRRLSGSFRRLQASKLAKGPVDGTSLDTDPGPFALKPKPTHLSPLSPPDTSADHTQDSAGNTDCGEGSPESSGGMESKPKSRRKRRKITQNDDSAS